MASRNSRVFVEGQNRRIQDPTKTRATNAKLSEGQGLRLAQLMGGFKGDNIEEYYDQQQALFDKQTELDTATQGLSDQLIGSNRGYERINPTPGSDKRGDDFFSGGAGVADTINSYIDTIRELGGDKAAKRAQSLSRNRIDQANRRETHRQGLLGDQAAQQRQTRAINQAVLSGRKKRRGGSVALPKFALAGLNNSRGSLLR